MMSECIHKVDCPSTREYTLLDLVGPHWGTLFTPCCQEYYSQALHSPAHPFRGVERTDGVFRRSLLRGPGWGLAGRQDIVLRVPKVHDTDVHGTMLMPTGEWKK